MRKPKVIFMGTPQFAVPSLERLADNERVHLALVVTQPDRRAGRGRKLTSPPVKEAAVSRGVPVLQTHTLRDPEVKQRIIDVKPDLIVVAAFGMILGRWILELASAGCVNLHASILPAYRGANPIASAIALGEYETGVTLMRMDRGLDTGDIYVVRTLRIKEDDTTETLTTKLGTVASSLLDDHVEALISGALAHLPQGAGATLTRPLVKADGWIDWSRPATEIERRVRALWPWPRAWTALPDGTLMQIHAATPEKSVDASTRLPTGLVVEGGRVICGERTTLSFNRIQFAGGRPLDAVSFANLGQLRPGTLLGAIGAPEAPPPLVVPVSA